MRDSIADWYHSFYDDKTLMIERLNVKSKSVIIKIETGWQLNILKQFKIFLIYVIWCIEIKSSVISIFIFK